MSAKEKSRRCWKGKARTSKTNELETEATGEEKLGKGEERETCHEWYSTEEKGCGRWLCWVSKGDCKSQERSRRRVCMSSSSLLLFLLSKTRNDLRRSSSRRVVRDVHFSTREILDVDDLLGLPRAASSPVVRVLVVVRFVVSGGRGRSVSSSRLLGSRFDRLL